MLLYVIENNERRTLYPAIASEVGAYTNNMVISSELWQFSEHTENSILCLQWDLFTLFVLSTNSSHQVKLYKKKNSKIKAKLHLSINV